MNLTSSLKMRRVSRPSSWMRFYRLSTKTEMRVLGKCYETAKSMPTTLDMLRNQMKSMNSFHERTIE